MKTPIHPLWRGVALGLLMLGALPLWGAGTWNPTSSVNDNTAGGDGALSRFNTNQLSGAFNSAFGRFALSLDTTGGANSAFGFAALAQSTTGSFNNAFGAEALRNNGIGNDNSAFGAFTLKANTSGYGNTAIGRDALLSNTIGYWNTATGAYALKFNQTGKFNTGHGLSALVLNTTGSNNAAGGSYALNSNTTGNSNTAFGYASLKNLTTGSSNIALGVNAGTSLTSGSNNLYLGNGGAGSESATVRLGNPAVHTRTFVAGVRGRSTGLPDAVNVFIDSNGQLGTLNSSRRFKTEIQAMGEQSRRLLELRPVTYRYRTTPASAASAREYGLIAEEVAAVYPDLVTQGGDGQVETVQYHKLTPMMLNELQRLQRSLLETQTQLRVQQEQLEALQRDNRKLTAALAEQQAQWANRLTRLEAAVRASATVAGR